MNHQTAVGIIAGNGRFPFLIAEEAQAQGFKVVIAGLEKEAHPELERHADVFEWVKIGALQKLVDFFRAQGVREAVMAGKVEKVRLFQENVQPDFEMVKVLMKTRDFKDDSLLRGIADYLENAGVKLLDSTTLIKKALPGVGVLGKKRPSKEVQEDLAFGFKLAKDAAGLDIGQTVVVKKKAVMAIEAIEGTDAAILRGAELGGGEMTVVKVAKPQQDFRFDVPAVGLRTIQTLTESKASALGFEAGKTIFIDLEDVIKEADKKGIALVGLQGGVS